MYCQFCGKEIEDDVGYCPHCGRNLKRKPGTGGVYKYELTRLKVPKESKNPGAAAAIGFFMGWLFLGPVGYIYLGQWNWFWITFLVQIIAYPITGIVPAYILLPIVYGIHQYQMAKELNELLAAQREAQQGATGAEEGAEETGPAEGI
jgi:hypothetical protein